MGAVAYAASRFPATYAAVTAALRSVLTQRPGWRPRSMLDLGAGLGAGTWAAADLWLSLETATSIDLEPEMVGLGRELGDGAEHRLVRDAEWIVGDFRSHVKDASHDLVVLSYVLGEWDEGSLSELLAVAWEATAGSLVVVEPGTPAGYRRMIQARTELVSAGGFVTAPCPHDAPCPMNGDWCHFAVRVGRTRLHRIAKRGISSFEDEKFSYVAVSREPTDRTEARVVRHPQIRPGNIRIELCSPTGLDTLVATRSDKDLFKRARKVSWGETFSEPRSPGAA